MDNPDIRSSIIEHIFNIQDLLNISIIDKLGVNIASTKCFWVKQFIKHDLPLTNKVYHHYVQWREFFLHCIWSMHESINLIGAAKHHAFYPKLNKLLLYQYNKILDQCNCTRFVYSCKCVNGSFERTENEKGFKKYILNKEIKIDYVEVFIYEYNTHQTFILHLNHKYDIKKLYYFEFEITIEQTKNLLYHLIKQKYFYN